jgi:hypothetical protein
MAIAFPDIDPWFMSNRPFEGTFLELSERGEKRLSPASARFLSALTG